MARSDPRREQALDWLLDHGNPSVRFFTLRRLLHRPLGDADVAKAQAAIMDSPPVRTILVDMTSPGYWARTDDDHLRAHGVSVCLLAELGADPGHPLVRRACNHALEALVRVDGSIPSRHPKYGGLRPCYQGLIGEALVRLHAADDPRVGKAIAFAAGVRYQCPHNDDLPCAWGVVKLLRMLTAVPRSHRNEDVWLATECAVDFLVDYDVERADYPTATEPSKKWFYFGFPTGHESDLLELLDTLALAECERYPLLSGPIEFVRRKQQPDGRWLSEFVSPRAKELDIDREGEPSKWVTLRALCVLQWWEPPLWPDLAA